MKAAWRILGWVAGFLVLRAGPAAAEPRVLLVDVDGLDLRDPDRLPVMARLVREGVRSRAFEGPPGKGRLPAQASLLTGVPPALHHVWWEGEVPEHRRARSMTLFDQCKSYRVRSALISMDMAIRHATPDRNVDLLRPGMGSAAAAFTQAVRALDEKRCRLVVVQVDAGDDPAAVDRELGAMIRELGSKGLGKSVTVLLTSTQPIGPGTFVAWGNRVRPGKVLPRASLESVASTTLWLLDLPVPGFWRQKPLVHGFITRVEDPGLALPVDLVARIEAGRSSGQRTELKPPD